MTLDRDSFHELMLQLAHRHLYKNIHKFMSDHKLDAAAGWGNVERVLFARLLEDQAFLRKLTQFIRDLFLTTQKRVYVFLPEAKFDVAAFAKKFPKNGERDFLNGHAPDRKTEVSNFFDELTIGNATIHSFVTTRPSAYKVDISKDELDPQAREKFSEARELSAKFSKKVRCYDFVLERRGVVFLALDTGWGLVPKELQQDANAYYQLIVNEIYPERAPRPGAIVNTPPGDPADSEGARKPIFLDLFPAVRRIYEDRSEGVINHLEFLSNGEAKVAAGYRSSVDDDYRDHPFQVAGEKEAQMEPFSIAVKWPSIPGSPHVQLPGTRAMAVAASDGPNVLRFPLTYMEFPHYSSWSAFEFAIGRVLHHLRR